MKKLSSFAAIILLSTGMAFGQVTTGTLVGIVRDASGAAVANTAVTATNEATNLTYPGMTNGQGEFRISNLPAGKYDLRSTATGFAATTLTGIDVEANRDSTSDLKLAVASSSTVEVTSEAAVSLDTTNAQLQSTFSPVEVQDLPTASVGLGVLNLSLLAPGVASSGGIGAGTGPSIGGQRPRDNNFEIDGIDNNNKSVTGPLLRVPNDATSEFVLLQNFYGAQYGHSTGGQFNQLITTGTNSLHGRVYEYFQNRNLNAIDAVQARANVNLQPGMNPRPRYDNNRYGGELGGPAIKDKLFLFSNFERNSIGQASTPVTFCAPTAAGFSQLGAITFQSAANFGVYKQFSPVAANQAAAADAGCPSGNTINVTSAAGVPSAIPVGDVSLSNPVFTNSTFSTTAGDYTISAKDSFHVRYVYNREDALDTASTFSQFFINSPARFHLASLNEIHTFTANLSNDARFGFTRFASTTGVPNILFPGLTVFPNLIFDDLNAVNLGPDPNGPQGTITNLYQLIDNLTYVKGRHTIVIGGEARKSIAPQLFVQRARGDYEYTKLNLYLNDLSPDNVSQRNALGAVGTPTFYGDQTVFYAYGNDDWKVTPKLTLNMGLRYEFTSIPASEKLQSLNSAASVPGLITFGTPKPQYKNFAPRVGFNFAPDENTTIRGGFGINYDVLYDNIGTTEAPPQFQSTINGNLKVSTPGFLASGGLPGTFAFTTVAQQRAATTAYVPDQQLPYSETYTLSVQHVFHRDYTAEVRYVGTRGIHLDVQDQINKQSSATVATQLPTVFNGNTTIIPNGANTLASLLANSAVLPAFAAAGLTSNITADEPFAGSDYNGLQTQLTRRFQHGLLLNAAYTFSKTMDNSTADFNTSATNPRRPQDFQNISGDYSLSALDRKHRFTLEAVYDLPFFKHSNWYLKNLVGNLELTPIYTFQSPQYTTPQSAIDSNLNGDSAPDRVFINPNGQPGTASVVTPVIINNAACTGASSATTRSASINALISGTDNGTTSCQASIVGYAEGSISGTTGRFTGSNAQYVQGGLGTIPSSGRNILPTGRINDFDLSAYKRINVYGDRYKVEFGAQAFNVLNHPQFLPGSINQVNSIGSTGFRGFDSVTTPGTFNQKQAVFSSNSRSMQLSGKIIF